MKKIQRLIMFVCMFTIVGLGQAFGQDPIIICPADITIEIDQDYTDTNITGVATSEGINGSEEVEYNDIIVNFDNNNEGFARRRWNVVDRSDIFCDETITVGNPSAPLACNANIVASLTSGTSDSGPGKVKLFSQSFVENESDFTNLKVSRDGVFFADFVEFYCCDIGTQPYYIQATNEDGNVETCNGLILIEDKLAPIIDDNSTIYIALFGQNSVELTVNMLSEVVYDNCEVVTATFAQSQFDALGTYNVDYTLSDPSGNTSQGTISVIVITGNTIACNNLLNVSLDQDGSALITPDMLLEGPMPVNGNYTVSINGGPFTQMGLMNCSDQGNENEISIQEETTGNQCWSSVIIEDKSHPVLSVPNTIYLTLNPSTEALLTVDMLERFTYDNCTIATMSLSQGLFSSTGTFEVIYTVTDDAGNVSSQTFDVDVSSGNLALSCNDNINVVLGSENTIMVDAFTQLEGQVYLNGNYTVGIGYAPDYDEPITYSESLTLDCSHVGEDIALVILDGDTGNKCWGLINVIDETAPTPYAQNSISVSMNGAEPYILDPALVDLGSFDNCDGELTMTVTPNTFYSPGIYQVKLRVYDESGNSDFALSNLIIEQGEGIPIECVGISTALTNPLGPTTLYAVDFVLNSDDFETFTMSTNPNGPYSETIDFDCSQYNLDQPIDLFVLGLNDGVPSSCTVSLTLVDNIPPVVVVNQNITLTLINGQATLAPEDLDNGSYDLCGSVELELSQTLFTTAHLGENQVYLTATDESGNTNQTWGTVTVIDGGESTMQCITLSTALLNQFGPTTLYAVDFLLNPNDFASVTMSTSQDGPYTETIDFDCVNYEVNIPFNIFIKAGNSVETSTCVVSLILHDNIIPIAIADQNITLQLNNGQATLFPESVDDGSYDNCGSISLSLSQTLFTTAHIGENQVTLTVTDESGNINEVVTTVTVLGNGNGCSVDNILFPEDIFIFDADGELENLSIDNLQSFYSYSYSQVYPYVAIPSQIICDNIVFTYQDEIFVLSQGYKILRTFTAIDWLTTSIATQTQIIELSLVANTSLACNDNITINVGNGSIQMFPEDVLEGNNYDYSTMGLTIEDDGNIIPNNIITSDYIGQSLTYQVTDNTTGNSCWGSITVISEDSDCHIQEENISFPLPTIYLANTNADPAIYTPENLVSIYGFDVSEVNIIVTPDCPESIWGYTYDDTVFNYADGNFKIVREFTVIDWNTYDPGSMEGIWTFTQTIIIGINPSELICDVLPNSAPVGDCDTGHSLDDDVEWPSDLSVADYRITPEGLIEFSNVTEQDARPIFFNNPDDYTATYVDLLVELTPSTLTVARIWKAVNDTYDLDWHYSQTIVVDFSGFENLVTVNTATDRAVPGVIINGDYETNMEGETQVLGEIISIDFEDEVLNGINVKDLILIQRHILGLENLDERLILASDVNSDGNVSAADILNLRKRILGITSTIKWEFINTQISDESILQPKASYLAYKEGDVDDNAVLPGEDELPITAKLTIEDKVLNNGETYMIPVSIEDLDLLMGMEIRLGIDSDLLTFNGIENNLGFAMEDSELSNDGELVIIMNDFLDAQDLTLDDNNAVVYIECTANANILLHDAIKVSNRTSYAVDENLNLYAVGGEIENMITGTNSPELASLNVFPNPTTDYLRIDQSGISVKGNLNVSIINAQGQLIITQTSDVIDVQNLSEGMYYYKISIGEYETKGKFIVVR